MPWQGIHCVKLLYNYIWVFFLYVWILVHVVCLDKVLNNIFVFSLLRRETVKEEGIYVLYHIMLNIANVWQMIEWNPECVIWIRNTLTMAQFVPRFCTVQKPTISSAQLFSSMATYVHTHVYTVFTYPNVWAVFLYILRPLE